jgi:hypothetical protein
VTRLQCDGRAQGGVTGPNKGEAVGLGVRAVSTAEIAAGDAGRADCATASRNTGLWGSASRRSVGLGVWWSRATGSEGAAGMAEEEQRRSGAGKKKERRGGCRQVGPAYRWLVRLQAEGGGVRELG